MSASFCNDIGIGLSPIQDYPYSSQLLHWNLDIYEMLHLLVQHHLDVIDPNSYDAGMIPELNLTVRNDLEI